ncbi:MAG: CCA tRNA nucleotidyltransferase [Novosphingobium sp.]|nr:CCA tRNA nucleotidyltransferase [Novosphingobium sp.]
MFRKINEIFKDKKIYLVGGSVRDRILGKIPKDYDFSTPLSPEEIENVIRQAGKKPYLVGKRFGTIGMKVDGEMIEITTFRTESYKNGNRKPEVNFVKDITADLSRRDFTINAMAQSSTGKIIDPFGGIDDLQRMTIKCVGQPSHRFKEDPLRMLRAGRFASQLGFVVEEKTQSAIKQLNHKILEVSKERWVMELDKMLMTDKPSIGFDFLMETRLMNFMIPELALQYNYDQNSIYHNLTLWEHTKKALDSTPDDIMLRWSILFHDLGKPFTRTDKYTDGKWVKANYIKHDLVGAELVEKIAKYLKWSNERTKTVVNLVRNHLNDDSPLREYDQQGK